MSIPEGGGFASSLDECKLWFELLQQNPLERTLASHDNIEAASWIHPTLQKQLVDQTFRHVSAHTIGRNRSAWMGSNNPRIEDAFGISYFESITSYQLTDGRTRDEKYEFFVWCDHLEKGGKEGTFVIFAFRSIPSGVQPRRTLVVLMLGQHTDYFNNAKELGETATSRFIRACDLIPVNTREVRIAVRLH